MIQSQTVSAIIVAGGSGARFGSERPKQLALLKMHPILSHTVSLFEKLNFVDEIVVVLPQDWRNTMEVEAIAPFCFRKVKCVNGGASRTESTRQGLKATTGDIILVHDGVRPLVSSAVVRGVAEAAISTGAALAAAPMRDTLKLGKDGLVECTVDRHNMWQAQTPQGFQREILLAALADPTAAATDEAGLVEQLGRPVALVPSSHHNLKITSPDDLMTAEALMSPLTTIETRVRVGQGYDVHRLAEGRKLFLGCVEVPFDKGLLGHSDADVMAHALADALLGAAGLGDIGEHFSDKDPRWAGVSGADILAETMEKLNAQGFECLNADITLIGECPKIAPYREAMREAVAAALGLEDPSAINVKATTTEGLGFTGTGKALAAMAIVAIRAIW